MNIGPQTLLADKTHADKYRMIGETFREAMNRLASTLKDSDKHYYFLREIFLTQRFMPAGRIQAAVGSTRRITPNNCYVSGIIEDNFTGLDGIMQRASEAAETMRHGGGIGYNFSTIRPRGWPIKSLESNASGPVSFMGIYDAVCRVVASSGHRRGAQMGVLRIDHPDIEEFIHSKQNSTALTGFNISIAVTDDFMQAVKENKTFPLMFNGEVHKEIKAKALWEQIMRSTWDWAEPGVLFIDAINRNNNLYYCEQITTTNPCAEQPLPPYGACLLGSFNLSKYIIRNEEKQRWEFNLTQFVKDVPHVVRAMDNVINDALYPLEKQKEEAFNKRRMGIGVTGLANAGEALGFPYGSERFIMFESKILQVLEEEVYKASIQLAKEKGAFPLFEKNQYSKSLYIQHLPDNIQQAIWDNGIRNSHLTSIAPTGTISLCADNVSSGIEPVFSYQYERTIVEEEGPRIYKVEDYGKKFFNVEGKTAEECSADDHLNVLIEANKHVDSSVSKTCNVAPNMPWEDFEKIYFKAWEAGCKGCTTFNPGGKRIGIIRESSEEELENLSEESEACYVDEVTGTTHCD